MSRCQTMHPDRQAQRETLHREGTGSDYFSASVVLSNSTLSRFAFAGIVLLQTLGRLAAAPPASPPTSEPSANPSALEAIHHALREFDRFLDHHPLLEDRLRLEPRLALDQDFLEKNMELKSFLAANPQASVGFKMYPRYFLYRALLRQASAPVSYLEISRLKEVLDHEPAIEQQLIEHPSAIRDPLFVKEHPPLRQFFLRNPRLSHFFIHDLNTT